MSEGLWIFGYGSLMWRPGFPYVRRTKARVHGLSRKLCVLSVHHRGTERRPGLVLGLDRGGVCDGMAFLVARDNVTDVRAYLKAREQVNGVYREARIQVTPTGPEGRADCGSETNRKAAAADRDPLKPAGREAEKQISAITFIVERAHPSYQPRLGLDEQAQMVLGASGLSGPNVAYVINTVLHLRQLGIEDRHLERLLVKLGPVFVRRCMTARSEKKRTQAGSADGEVGQSQITQHSAGSGDLKEMSGLPLPRSVKHRPMKTEQRKRFQYRSGRS
ncbi:MAG: gamma-glutamylcyclotransferase [Pseudomonadota bacterium]